MSFTGPRDPDVSANTPALSDGSYQGGSVSVGTTATLICTVPAGYNGGVLVNSSAAVFIGDSAVTTSAGFPVAASTAGTNSVVVPGGKGVSRDLYGIVASGTATVKYLFAAD